MEINRLVLLAWLAAVFVFLFLPIVVIIIYSFNGGRNLYVWTEWSTHWYGAIFDNPRATSALAVSLQTAFFNAVIAVALGQMIWMDRIGLFDGITRLSIGHSLFNIAVVALIVRARAEGLGEQLEQAAGDLGAPPWRAFKDITLPLMFPAVFAGLLLSFTFSFDDVIISLFVQRPGTSTFPIYILSSMKAGLKGDVAALAVLMLLASFVGVGFAATLLSRSGKGKTLGG